MHSMRPVWILVSLSLLSLSGFANGEISGGRTLQSDSLSLTIQQRGAIITNLHHRESHANWLSAETKQSQGMFAHFLCFDRWGAVSREEKKQGLFYHGEAVQQVWNRASAMPGRDALSVTLPAVGLQAQRSVSLTKEGSVFAITNLFKNPTKRSRHYNAVEHITLSSNGFGPNTRLYSNAQRGLVLHRNKLTTTQAYAWPYFELNGKTWDARVGANVPARSSTSWVFPDGDVWGWVCILNTATRELLGYVWPTSDYPWLIIWTRYQKGRITDRAIEPGTTGLSLPFDELVSRGPMLGQPLLNTLQPGEERRQRIWGFLIKLPPDSGGVSNVSIADHQLSISMDAEPTPLKYSLKHD